MKPPELWEWVRTIKPTNKQGLCTYISGKEKEITAPAIREHFQKHLLYCHCEKLWDNERIVAPLWAGTGVPVSLPHTLAQTARLLRVITRAVCLSVCWSLAMQRRVFNHLPHNAGQLPATLRCFLFNTNKNKHMDSVCLYLAQINQRPSDSLAKWSCVSFLLQTFLFFFAFELYPAFLVSVIFPQYLTYLFNYFAT